MDINMGQYGNMLLYAIFKTEIDHYHSIGQRIVMIEFISELEYKNWVISGVNSHKVIIKAYELDSSYGKQIHNADYKSFEFLSNNCNSIMMIPFYHTDKIKPINTLVFVRDCMSNDDAKSLLERHTFHINIK
jgi:hypothetical protein